MATKSGRILFLSIALGFAGLATPAMAGCHSYAGSCWWRAHHAIYHKESHIAFLEADPRVDDGYKGPVITALHWRILRLRTAFGPRWPHWPTPCCYSRKPMIIR